MKIIFKGEGKGHPFRGNQYTGGKGMNVDPDTEAPDLVGCL